MISTEIWSGEIMDDELTDVFDQAGHLATSAYKEEFFTINHLMLSLLRTKSVTKILGNHVTESAMKTWETELMKSFNDNPFPIRELKYENLMQNLYSVCLDLANTMQSEKIKIIHVHNCRNRQHAHRIICQILFGNMKSSIFQIVHEFTIIKLMIFH